ncbi:hypothetical protein V6N13_040250 [Hibiscus sabdariffa]
MYWASLAPTPLVPWSLRPGLPVREQICSLICARVRLASPLRSAWRAWETRVAAHPAAWLLLVAVAVVARVPTGLARNCKRSSSLSCKRSSSLACKFSACVSVCIPAHFGVVGCSR